MQKLIIFVSLLIIAVNGAPAKNDDVELIEVVPLEKQNASHAFGADYDDDYPPASFVPVAYFPFNIDFRSLFTGFDDWIDRMRNRFHGIVSGEGLDGDKGNTTSTVKVVDNHKVTINDTVYKKDTPYGTQFVKVRTVHVRPVNESAEVDSISTTAASDEKVRDTEQIESESDDDEANQVLNERQTEKHAKSGKLKGSATIMLRDAPSQSSSSSSSRESLEVREAPLEHIQIFTLPNSHQSIVNAPPEQTSPHRQPRPTFYNTNPNRPVNNINRPQFPPSFSYPINHNFNRPVYPPPQRPFVNEVPQPIYNTELQDDDDDRFGNSGPYSGQTASEVFDLTNDIRVNQILSEQGRPFNPDAEFISVPNQPRPRPFESYPQQYPPYYFTAFRDIKDIKK
ncbi:uncharacterized protein LOC134837929 [Culicoides brevitarsis]|uniref:uncharacterized protein LOC134837929 n=1 Tax=Culicoides brevitarsis TaxID=469753 RepID=UPI00307BA693